MSKFNSMKQSYYDLALSVQRWNEYLAQNSTGVSVQKMYSSAHFVVWILRFSGETKYFYIGRGKEFEGIFIGDRNVPAEYRAQDSFLEYLRSHIRGSRIYNIIMDRDDRAVCFKMGRSKEHFSFLLFWRGRELFFLFSENQEQGKYRVTCSWDRKSRALHLEDEYQLFDLFNEVGRKVLECQQKSNQCMDIDSYLNALDSETHQAEGKKRKSLLKRVELIKGDLIKFEKWKRLFEEVRGDQYPLLEKSFKQSGIKLKFTDEQNYYHRKSLLLDKLKKFREYRSFAQDRLRMTQAKLEGISIQSNQVKTIFNPMTHKHYASDKQQKVVDKGPDGIYYFETSEGKLALGTTAQSNDYIRNKWAHKNDYWFHLDGDTSPHVIFRGVDDTRPTLSIIQLIGSMIIEYSKLEYQQINIIYTQVKNLKAVKGSPGKVIYKKEKHLQVWKEEQWRKNLLELP